MIWITVASPVSQEELGIMDLGNMNKSLAAKCIYNYSNNKEAPWKKVVCTRSKSDTNSLMSVLGKDNNKSVRLRVVDTVIGMSGLAREMIHQKF